MYSGFAFGGKARAGKNMLAARLAHTMTEGGEWPVFVSFATKLKEIVAAENGHARKDRDARVEMLRIGDRERSIDADVFVKALRNEVDEIFRYGGTPIVTDVRRANEFHWCQDAGLFMVYVDAPLQDRLARLRAIGEAEWVAYTDHPTESEASAFAWDHQVWNEHSEDRDATLTRLALEIRQAAQWL